MAQGGVGVITLPWDLSGPVPQARLLWVLRSRSQSLPWLVERPWVSGLVEFSDSFVNRLFSGGPVGLLGSLGCADRHEELWKEGIIGMTRVIPQAKSWSPASGPGLWGWGSSLALVGRASRKSGPGPEVTAVQRHRTHKGQKHQEG